MPPFETYMIPVSHPDPAAGQPTRSLAAKPFADVKTAGELAEEVTGRHEAVAREGGKVVAQHMVEAAEDIEGSRNRILSQYVMVVAEFPEPPVAELDL